MAREGDVPRWLAAVHPRFLVPHRAELVLAVVVSVLVLLTDLRGAIAFSSFGVLLYYAIANLAAFTQPKEQRRYPKGLQVLGLVGCVGLVVTLPVAGVIGGVIVLVVGVALRLVRLRLGRYSAGS
jgi:APA family basic amino acid/polyamine antiporter